MRFCAGQGRRGWCGWDISAAVDEAMLCVTYLYLENVNGVLTNYALYTDPTNEEKSILYELQIMKLPKRF